MHARAVRRSIHRRGRPFLRAAVRTGYIIAIFVAVLVVDQAVVRSGGQQAVIPLDEVESIQVRNNRGTLHTWYRWAGERNKGFIAHYVEAVATPTPSPTPTPAVTVEPDPTPTPTPAPPPAAFTISGTGPRYHTVQAGPGRYTCSVSVELPNHNGGRFGVQFSGVMHGGTWYGQRMLKNVYPFRFSDEFSRVHYSEWGYRTWTHDFPYTGDRAGRVITFVAEPQRQIDTMAPYPGRGYVLNVSSAQEYGGKPLAWTFSCEPVP